MIKRNIRIIPRLDIKGENLIKSINLEGLKIVGDPHTFAKEYYEDGADELIFIDTVASLYGRNNLNNIIEKSTKDIFVPITVGGGIRTIEDAKKLLRSGADKLAINSAAVRNPRIISELARVFGSQCVVLSVQAKRIDSQHWEVFIDNGREKSNKDLVKWILEAIALGAGEILLTSIDKEGTNKGFEIDLIETVTKVSSVPVIVSGGMGSLDHLKQLCIKSKIEGVAIADMLHYKKTKVQNIKEYMNNYLGNNLLDD